MFRLCWAILLLVVAPISLRSNELIKITDFSLGTDAKGVPSPWQLKQKVGQADFTLTNHEGFAALLLRSDNTSFSFQREVKVDLKEHPILSWKWKVTKLPKDGDFRSSKTDDQAAQLFVAFSRAKTIVYLWDTTAPQGLMDDAVAPPFMSIKVVVVRSGSSETGKWITESRNVYEDYRKLFGNSDAPPVVSGMRLQINTQHTKSSAEAAFADVVFKPKAEPQ